MLPIFTIGNIFEIKAGLKSIRCCPFGRNHHIMAWLIPEIIAEIHACCIIFPTPDNIEILIKMQITAGSFTIGITQHRNNNICAQTMHRMRGRQIGFLLNFFTVNGFKQGRFTWISSRINNIEIRCPHTRYDQIASFHIAIVIAR